MQRRAIISGGSIAGLFAAVALMRVGWYVDIYERTNIALAGRGAGIVTHDILIDALKLVGADMVDPGVQVNDRIAFDKNGVQVKILPYQQVVTSWDRIYQILRRLIPDDQYHLRSHITGYEQDADQVTALFADGSYQKGDLLVGCDGFRSAIRGQMLPEVSPKYAGYVVWRALANEQDLSLSLKKDIFSTFSFYLPSGTQVIGYPIAGPNNDIRPGHRRYNFVWYAPTLPEVLKNMLTDERGEYHPISIPPPLIAPRIIEEMLIQAEATLPRPFFDILTSSERPFFTPIYDHHSSIMHSGRVALAGDSACVARPHVGMGVTKAAQDALTLARHAQINKTIDLQPYSDERVPLSLKAHILAQKLGSWLFDCDPSNFDGSRHTHLDEIMALTAVTVT